MKHVWKVTEFGGTDIFAADLPEYHNGPQCTACGLEFCRHCEPELEDSECEGAGTRGPVAPSTPAGPEYVI